MLTTVYIDARGEKHWGVMARMVAEREGGQVTFEGLRPWCSACGWRKGGLDSWDGVKCKCGFSEPPLRRIDE